MKNILTIVFLGSFGITNLLCQNFTFKSENPFGIKTIKDDESRPTQKVMFFDYDGDGDLDILHSGIASLDNVEEFEWSNVHYFLEIQENIGDAHNPQFGPRQSIFENFPFPEGYFFPCAGDLNGDGKVDFLVNGAVDDIGNRTFIYSKNVSVGQTPQFENIKLSVFGLDDLVAESFFIPELIDLDSDGDLDILLSGFNPAFGEENGPDIPVNYYAKNRGTKTQPDFVGWYYDPFGLVQSPLIEILCAGDIDNDGDTDALGANLLIPSDSINFLSVHMNSSGPDGRPVFTNTLHSPFGLSTSFGDKQYMFPNLVDIDGDSDLDLFVFKGVASELVLQYYENHLCTPETSSFTANICSGNSLNLGGMEFTDPGTYVVPLTGSDGCDSTVTLTLFVETVDNSVNVIQNTITAGLSNLIYQWIDCDTGIEIPGATGQSYTANTTGNYAVKITSLSGCSSISECIPIVTSGTKKLKWEDSVNIYPNPATGMVHILNASNFPVTKITVTSITGTKMKEINVSGKNTIDISSLSSGTYLLKLEINNVEIVKKLIVN